MELLKELGKNFEIAEQMHVIGNNEDMRDEMNKLVSEKIWTKLIGFPVLNIVSRETHNHALLVQYLVME